MDGWACYSTPSPGQPECGGQDDRGPGGKEWPPRNVVGACAATGAVVVWQCQLELAPVGRFDLAPVALGGRVFRAWASR